MPPKGYADWAWVQHMLTSARTRRPAASPSCCRRARCSGQGAEATDPQHMLKADLVEAVIGLAPEPLLRHRPRRLRADPPPATSRPSGRARCSSSTARSCSSAAATRTPWSPSTPQQLARRLPSCSATSTASLTSSTWTRSQRNDCNLNIPLYVAPADTGEKMTLAQALTDLEAAQAKAAETRAALEAELAKWGLSA